MARPWFWFRLWNYVILRSLNLPLLYERLLDAIRGYKRDTSEGGVDPLIDADFLYYRRVTKARSFGFLCMFLVDSDGICSHTPSYPKIKRSLDPDELWSTLWNLMTRRGGARSQLFTGNRGKIVIDRVRPCTGACYTRVTVDAYLSRLFSQEKHPFCQHESCFISY